MPNYAYRWADGTLSVCNARNKDEAARLFDEIGSVSRKLIIRIHAPLIFTLKPDIEKGWIFDRDYPLGDLLVDEILLKCFPWFGLINRIYESVFGNGADPETVKKKLHEALQRDLNDVQKLIERTPETPDIVLLFPKGMPGQNN
jgi:hypothetical protein